MHMKEVYEHIKEYGRWIMQTAQMTHMQMKHVLEYSQLCSGITVARVFNWQLYALIPEINLFAFIQELFHEYFSPIVRRSTAILE